MTKNVKELPKMSTMTIPRKIKRSNYSHLILAWWLQYIRVNTRTRRIKYV